MLDVATGIGEPAITAACHVGPTGRVLALDRSAEMLIVARQRAKALGLTNVEFLQADAECLCFPARSFQAALCRFGLMFFRDLKSVLAMLFRVLVPNGRLAAAIWAEPSQVPLIALPLEIIEDAVHRPLLAPGTPGPFGLTDADVLARMLEEEGFTGVRHESVEVVIEFSSALQYVEFIQAVLPEGRQLAQLPPEQQAEIWGTLAERARADHSADGLIRFSNRAICIVGIRDLSEV